jgi:hypothetical protein
MTEHRPWSPAEVEEEARRVLDDLGDAVLNLATLTETAAGAKRDHKREHSKAWLVVAGKNKEEREARVYLHQWIPTQTVGDLEYAAELAEGVVRSARTRIGVLQSRSDLLRSLLASARTVT